MFRKVLRSKIHRATVTHADLHYEGSITLPPELLKAAKIASYEAVCVWNVTCGTRFETYAIKGKKGSTDICINGAAAHMVTLGDIIIIACFNYLKSDQVKKHKPTVVFVDKNNQIVTKRKEVPGPDSTEELIRV